ncbi:MULTISPECIES: anthranilate synthase component I family protein [Dictyoglomus]|uniref:Anthranilate synthase component 1 n=1 Tax=Dictyoglomus turgidum (strain DSM 6724 / Z-1310) TaxID=515635 RepID=B8DZP2_DICTD|nr:MULTISPECIES: anthranilate synthase component I family protein [Dictyoglomus]ACK41975.1 Anthranilate synthase [Dictyoglomus turgidum DSM 6724]HBU31465.1 anthranilate synthase component I family protein [Dictyoglomus sp.]
MEKILSTKNYVPIIYDFPGDFETPSSLLFKVRDEDFLFLLESAEGGERVGRYSFISWRPKEVLTFNNDVNFDILTYLSERFPVVNVKNGKILPRFVGGLVGYFGYDLVRQWEKLPNLTHDPIGFPLAEFQVVDFLVVFDHLKRRISVIFLIPEEEIGNFEVKDRIEEKISEIKEVLKKPVGNLCKANINAQIENLTSKDEYEENVKKAIEYIKAGEIFQVVYSQRFYTRYEGDPYLLYRALRFVNPSPYMFFLKFKDRYLIGSSPEALVKVEEGKAEIRPIAGTRRRGKDEEEDISLEKELLRDEKEKAEHTMLLDLARNDLGRVAKIGTVRCENLMHVEKYSHVMHLVSTVTCDVREGIHPLEVLRASFPAGTVSGAPKVRAMEIIEELEKYRRGPYAGGVGYFSLNGNLDTCITIRTYLLKGKDLFIQTGAGIVYDSIPEREYKECINKAKALFEAIKIVGDI